MGDWTNLDKILEEFSIFGSYHRSMFFYLFLTYFSNAMITSSFVFSANKIEYRCQDSNKTWSNANLSECSEWIYDEPNSFVAEFGLACQEWKRTLVGTTHGIGYMCGLLLVGSLSDRLGRKKVIVITGVLGGIIGLAKSFSPSYWLYIALEFLGAAIGDISSPSFVLNVEIVETKKRVPFYIFCCSGYCFGGIVLSLVAWAVPYWRTFLRVVYAPSTLFFFYAFLIDESPRWLLINGQKEKAFHILKMAAAKNKLHLDSEALQNINCEADKSVRLCELLKITIKSRTMLKRCLVCTVWWTTSTFVYYGLIIHCVSLEGNKYWNFAIMSSIDIPVLFIIMYVMMKFKRKIPLITTFLFGAVLCFIQPFTPAHLSWLSILIYMAGKSMSSLYLNIIYMYTSELFPTDIRNSMHALCSSLGRLGSILAPQAPLLMVYWSSLPSVVFGTSALIGGLVTFFVPETADDSLPDTVCQAESLGKVAKMKTGLDYITSEDLEATNKMIS